MNSAARLADRGPSPGSLARYWIRLSISDMSETGRKAAILPDHVAVKNRGRALKRELNTRRQLKPARNLRHPFGDVRLELGLSIVEGGYDQIF